MALPVESPLAPMLAKAAASVPTDESGSWLYETKWDGFATDPEWLEARAKSEEDGPIVARIRNTFMRPTDYSPAP